MAFQPNFEKVISSIRKNLGNTQSQIECKFPDTNDASKIICSNAKVNISSIEATNKDITYSGFVNFQVVYQNNNNEPVGVDYTAQFKDKFSYNMDTENYIPVISASVVDVSTTLMGDIKCVATVEICIDAIVNSSYNALTDIVGDNTHTKKDLFNYSNFITTINNTFEVVNDVEIKDGVNKILSVCPSVYFNKITPNNEVLVVNGSVYLSVCYLADNGTVHTEEYKYDFSQEIANTDVDEDSLVESRLEIAYNEIKVTTSIDTDSAILNIVLPVTYWGYVFKNNTTEIVTDLYCTRHYTKVGVQSIDTLQNISDVIYDDKITGSTSIQDNDPFIDEVLGTCCGSVVVANNVIQDGTLYVEGVATTSVMYFNKETNSIYSVDVEMPFSATTNVNYNSMNNVPVQVALTDVSSRSRRGKELEVVANIQVYANLYTTENNAIITQVAEEDEIPESDCAMSFYVTKDGDTLWEIAKELKVSTDMLIQQNPSLSEPITAGTKVVVYRQRQVEF